MITINTINPEWILSIVEEDRHRKELAAMIAEVEYELSTKTRQIIEKKPFK